MRDLIPTTKRSFFNFILSFTIAALIFICMPMLVLADAGAAAGEVPSGLIGKIILWMLAIMALLQALQAFLAFLAVKLDKDPLHESGFEKFVRYFGKVCGWLSKLINLFTANSKAPPPKK